jgi:hypothetical protein
VAAARVFSVEFRVVVAERILNGESVSALNSEGTKISQHVTLEVANRSRPRHKIPR